MGEQSVSQSPLTPQQQPPHPNHAPTTPREIPSPRRRVSKKLIVVLVLIIVGIFVALSIAKQPQAAPSTAPVPTADSTVVDVPALDDDAFLADLAGKMHQPGYVERQPAMVLQWAKNTCVRLKEGIELSKILDGLGDVSGSQHDRPIVLKAIVTNYCPQYLGSLGSAG
jgi:hypothetical protein